MPLIGDTRLGPTKIYIMRATIAPKLVLFFHNNIVQTVEKRRINLSTFRQRS